MYKLFRNFLFRLDPETAHHFSLNFLKFLYQCKLLRKKTYVGNPVQLMGLHFPNRIGLAAGLDRNGDYIDTLATFGFGFIEIGTITPNFVAGNPRPRMFRLVQEEAIINRMGFANAGLDYSLKQLKKMRYRGILGINIGKNPKTPNDKAIHDYVHCFKALWPYASYITINISSPNTAGLRDLQQSEQLSALLHALKQEQTVVLNEQKKYVPLVVKIAPDLSQAEITKVAEVLLQENIDGVIATNTTIQRPFPTEVLHGNEMGGLSGKPLHSLSVNVIKQLRQTVGDKIPIIGCGGNVNTAFAQEKLKAGASLLQVYTGFIYQGPKLIKELVGM